MKKVRVSLLMPEGMHEEVGRSAEENKRTFTGEVLFRLERGHDYGEEELGGEVKDPFNSVEDLPEPAKDFSKSAQTKWKHRKSR